MYLRIKGRGLFSLSKEDPHNFSRDGLDLIFKKMYKINDGESFRCRVREKISLLIDSGRRSRSSVFSEKNASEPGSVGSFIFPDEMQEKTETSNVSANIETGIFNFSIDLALKKNIIKKWENDIFVQIYIDRLRSIYINLKNPQLIDKIIKGEIKPEILAFMTHQQFDPKKWVELLQLKEKKDASKFIENIEASTDAYVCRRCKSRKCTYNAIQIRSSDEPMTIFVNCLNCGKNWTC